MSILIHSDIDWETIFTEVIPAIRHVSGSIPVDTFLFPWFIGFNMTPKHNRILQKYYAKYPPDTVILCLIGPVEPFVPTARIIVLKTDSRRFIVAQDSGVLTDILPDSECFILKESEKSFFFSIGHIAGLLATKEFSQVVGFLEPMDRRELKTIPENEIAHWKNRTD